MELQQIVILSTEGLSVTLIFMDSTKGWSFINEDATSSTGATLYYSNWWNLVVAGGGDLVEHTFTGLELYVFLCAGNFAGSDQFEYLVVAGGGSGGAPKWSIRGGGGGAGGFRFFTNFSILQVFIQQNL